MRKKSNKKNQKKTTQKSNFSKFSIFAAPYSYIIIAAVVFLLYFRILGFPLGKLDEDAIITNNLPYITNISNATDALTRGAYFNADNILFYRPVQNLSFMLDAQLSGGSLWGFYFFNIVIHALTCIGIYILFKKLQFNLQVSLLSALLFAVNPLFTHSVAWIPSRGDLLLGLFGVFLMISYVKFTEKKNYLYLLIAAILYFLSMFSKESGIVLSSFPALYVLFDASHRKNLKNHIFPMCVFALESVIFLLIRNSVVNVKTGGEIFGIGLLFTNLQTIPELFGKYFIPVNLSPMPGYSLLSTVIGLGVMALAIFFILKLNKEQKNLAWFSLSLFFMGLLPGMLFSRDFGEFGYQYLEHRAYLPSVGLALIIAMFLIRLLSEKSRGNSIVSIIILIIVFYAAFSFARTNNYKDAISFYDYAVASNPKSAMALCNRGTLNNNNKKHQEALNDYMEAISLKPDYAEAVHNIGVVFGDLKNNAAAIKYYTKAISLKAAYPDAYYNRAIAKKELNDIQGALSDYNKAIELNPKYTQAYVNRSFLKKAMNDFNGAIEDCNIAISINPRMFEAWSARASAKFSAKDFNGSIEDYEKTISLKPNDASLYMNKGAARFSKSDFKGATGDFSTAIAIEPKLTGAYFYRGLSEQNMGSMKEACNDFKIAASMGDPNAAALMNQICK